MTQHAHASIAHGSHIGSAVPCARRGNKRKCRRIFKILSTLKERLPWLHMAHMHRHVTQTCQNWNYNLIVLLSCYQLAPSHFVLALCTRIVISDPHLLGMDLTHLLLASFTLLESFKKRASLLAFFLYTSCNTVNHHRRDYVCAAPAVPAQHSRPPCRTSCTCFPDTHQA